jgi:hypothetical protein
MQMFGLRPAVANERVLANSLAVAVRVDLATFQPGQGENCAAFLWDAGLDPGTTFAEYLKQLEAFEKLPPPRSAKDAAALKKAALAAAANSKGGSSLMKTGRGGTRDAAKLASAQETLAQLEAYDLKAELEQIAAAGPLNPAAAMRAAAAGGQARPA